MAQTDVALPGVLPLVLERTYVSSYRMGRAFGRTWASTLDMRLEPEESGAILVLADGALLAYRDMPSETPVFPEAGPRLGMTATPDGYAVTSAAAGVTWHFSGDGLPLTALTHRCGDRIDLIRNARGRVIEVVHSGGYRVGVGWRDDRVDRLFLHGLQGVAIPLVRFGYGDDGDLLAEVVNGSGLPLRFEYDGEDRLTQWLDRNGHWYTYAYDDRGRCVVSTGPERALATRLDYDERTRRTTVTDAMGHVTSYTYDARRHVVREVDPLGGVLLRDWDDHGHVVGLTDSTGATRHTFDEDGNLIRVTGPDGTVATASYSVHGLPETVTGPDGTQKSYTYDARGNLTSVTDAVGALTAYTYDRAGHLATVTDPLGATTVVESDGVGLPVRVTDAAGGSTSYQRDEAGRVVSITDALGARTRLHYSLDGLPIAHTGPDGEVESWEYDPQGNLIAHTTATGAVTRYEYGPFNVLTARTDPDGTRLTFTYDSQLRLTALTNPQGLTWSYSYDAAGRLAAETDFDGRTLTYATDAAGRLIARTNGTGHTTRYVRDVAGRVTERHSVEGITSFTYDAAGRLVRATSPQSEVTTTYDPAGRVLSETVDGRIITFSYDVAGRRVGRTTPAGVTSTWSHGLPGTPTALSLGDHAIELVHDAVGNLLERSIRTASSGHALRQEHDPRGRLVAQTLAGPAGTTVRRGYAYRSDGFLAAVSDLAGTRTVALDVVGRITAVTATGWQEQYAYDAAGNLTSATWTGDGDEAQGPREYDGTRIRSAGHFRYEHDAQGRIVLRQRARHSAKPLTWHYTWDSENRLVAVRTPDGTRWSYRYDPLGRRISKHRHTGDGGVAEQIDFTWDGTRLVEQTHHWFGSGAGPEVTTWDYAPGSYTPMAQRERRWTAATPQAAIDERFYGIIADLVGTPTHLTDPDGRVVWESRPTIWGTPTTVTGDDVDCPLRFPGHYYDAETGHHYNNQRYYDPATARYLSQDPLGLQPAPNPAAYVPNPTFEVDPLGLNGTPVGPTPEQIQHATQNVGGLAETQAQRIMEMAFRNGSSVVFGGSRVRGDYTAGSDLDVGFGSLTNNQANKLIKRVNGVADQDPTWIRMEETKIIPGNETPNIPRIESPEEFFARSGNRQPDDKGGAPYGPSGSHTYSPDGSISSRCPG